MVHKNIWLPRLDTFSTVNPVFWSREGRFSFSLPVEDWGEFNKLLTFQLSGVATKGGEGGLPGLFNVPLQSEPSIPTNRVKVKLNKFSFSSPAQSCRVSPTNPSSANLHFCPAWQDKISVAFPSVIHHSGPCRGFHQLSTYHLAICL